jgi:hypothetical protein
MTIAEGLVIKELRSSNAWTTCKAAAVFPCTNIKNSLSVAIALANHNSIACISDLSFAENSPGQRIRDSGHTSPPMSGPSQAASGRDASAGNQSLSLRDRRLCGTILAPGAKMFINQSFQILGRGSGTKSLTLTSGRRWSVRCEA